MPELFECAPVQSAGRLRGSSSRHGSCLQTSQGRCPWALPPSPSPLASLPPSEAHTRMASLVSLQSAFKDDPLCYIYEYHTHQYSVPMDYSIILDYPFLPLLPWNQDLHRLQ